MQTLQTHCCCSVIQKKSMNGDGYVKWYIIWGYVKYIQMHFADMNEEKNISFSLNKLMSRWNWKWRRKMWKLFLMNGLCIWRNCLEGRCICQLRIESGWLICWKPSEWDYRVAFVHVYSFTLWCIHTNAERKYRIQLKHLIFKVNTILPYTHFGFFASLNWFIIIIMLMLWAAIKKNTWIFRSSFVSNGFFSGLRCIVLVRSRVFFCGFQDFSHFFENFFWDYSFTILHHSHYIWYFFYLLFTISPASLYFVTTKSSEIVFSTSFSSVAAMLLSPNDYLICLNMMGFVYFKWENKKTRNNYKSRSAGKKTTRKWN